MSDKIKFSACETLKVLSVVDMDKFKCHKEVHATPMARRAYAKLMADAYGEQVDDVNGCDDDGYLVVYSRGTSDEYVSWSPKHVFDDGYTKI